jgi:hypothetical protein
MAALAQGLWISSERDVARANARVACPDGNASFPEKGLKM